MGGKTKHQRTKNNTKPSSSGRSAELLATSTIPTTVGFANVTQFGFLPTMLENFSIADSPSNGIDDMDASLDTNYQLVFRKMTKKDSITKVKALQEFSELTLKTDSATIKTILPFWPRLYNNLSTDVEHRVREAAQQAQAALMTQAGKNVAPYLKQIAPAWITSQYDTYAPAASIATQCFQKSFPAHKLQDVFNFCQNEILDYITKNLTVFTATTLSNPQSNTPEECEAKYQRVLICSLKGYALYLTKISDEHMNEASNKNTALIENPKFWSYQKHKNPGIRAAWFETISALLQSNVDLTKFEKQIAVAALQNIDETETIVLPHIWTAVLLVMQQIPEWPTYVNLEKALLPKLWKILKSGGAGSAETIYPHFLPLLSKLNRDIFGEKVLTFYGNFFEHLNTGLRARLTYQANSRSDIVAISNAYYECLQYILIQIQTIPSEAHDNGDNGSGSGSGSGSGGGGGGGFNAEQHALNLLQTHIIDVISYLLANANLSNGKYVLIRMVELIQFWNQNRATNSIYDALLTRFWDDLYATIENSFGNTEADQHLRSKLELIHDLVQSLRQRSINVSKVKSAKVKFNIDVEATTESDDANDRIDGNAKNDANKLIICFKDEINELIIKLCKFYMKKTSDSVTDHFVRPLENLLHEFGNGTKFFEQLCGGSAADIAKLYDKFASWLLLKEIRSESVLDIVLMLYHHLEPIEKCKLLNKLVKFPNESVKNWTLSRLLSHPLCTEPEVGRLLSQPIVTAQILKNAEEMAAGKTSETVNLMHKCFFQTESGDILIDNKTCESIIEILCNALTATDVNDTVLDTCVSFLAQIMPVICGDEQKGSTRDRMFVKLFGLCIDKERVAMLSEDTLWEAITSWQDALSSNDIHLTPALLETCAELIANSMNAIIIDSNVTLKHIESIAEIASKLIVCSIERFEDDDELKYQNADKILASIFTKLEKQYNEHFNGCLQACTFIELLIGGITTVSTIHRYLENDLGAIDVYKNANALLKLATFKFRAVFNITCTVPKSRKSSESENEADNGNENENENENNENNETNQHEHTDEKPTILEEEHTEDFCDMNESLLKKWSDKIYKEIFDAIYLGGLFNSFLNNFNLTPAFEEFILHFQELIRLFLTHIAPDKVDVIVKHWINADRLDDPFAVSSTLLLKDIGPFENKDNALALLHNDLTKACNGTENLQQYTNVLLTYTPKLALRQLSIRANIFGPSIDAHYRAIGLRCLLKNYFSSDCNEFGDQQIVNECMNLIDELYVQSKTNKEFLLYNDNISSIDAEKILQVTEFVRFVSDVIQTFPGNITENGWDFIRIAISSWVLTLSKSSEHWKSPKIAVFTSAIYKMFEVFSEFIAEEQIKSSSRIMSQMIDEWEHVFAKDVNLILLKCFMRFVQANACASDNRQEYFLKILSQAINRVDFKYVEVAHRIDSQTSIDDLIRFALNNLSHEYHTVRVACMTIIKCMSKYLIQNDLEQLNKRQERQTIDESADSTEWHLLHKFRAILLAQNEWTSKFIEEFNFKSTELDDFSEIPSEKSIPFMLLWHCVLEICNGAPSELRSTYASYLIDERFEQTFLQMLFRMMPAEVLRSQETKATGSAYFLPIEWHEIANDEISTDRYACHLYTLALKYLPALVRRWWTNSHPRQKSLVDKITTAFVSTQLCNDELRALLEKKEKHDTFQINVHQSTREVHATYVIDEARMELIIQMPLNFPLGVVKVNCGQQIGDKLQSRVVVMQLSIFLTHQNGSIWDGLSLWKRNLDRKFDGVEECYVCYSVIHQESCQLPKLTCKTCKKRFHGQCLYKWFSTSNKSTCPICRNIF